MSKVQVVAEVGSNWNTDSPLDSCKAFVDAVAEAGANYVKFQDWDPIKEFNRPQEWKMRSGRWTLEPELIPELRSYAQGRGIGFITSVFTESAVERARFHDVVKVASSEVTNQDLLRHIAGTVKFRASIWLSLGEVENPFQVTTAISRLLPIFYEVRLLACVAEYPVTRPLDLWESFTFAEQFALPLGVSSHIACPHCMVRVPELVKRRGAEVVEVHVRMRGVTPDDAPDNKAHSLWMDEFAALVEMIREME